MYLVLNSPPKVKLVSSPLIEYLKFLGAHGLSHVGLCYPGLSSEAKAHMWKSICVATLLTYACESMPMSSIDLCIMDKF